VVDDNGDFKGELKEQPELDTVWSVKWSEPIPTSFSRMLFGMFLFFGGIFLTRSILNHFTRGKHVKAAERELPYLSMDWNTGKKLEE